ncbi:MAG TPA: tetratricopeptide repeat protein, partial [Kofleriaceae bacterium]|nr:tetratricopeptide repeat protein [Kofleriaceae bacterium]
APALLALADARRLEGERTIEVERLLRQASQTPLAPELAREAELVQALLHVRDERLRDARVLLDKIAGASPSGDVRARLRLAWLDHLDGNKAPAVKSAEAVLAAQAEHEGARALLARLGAGEEETPEKPEKVEEPAAGGRTAPERASGGGGGGGKPARKEEPAEDSLDATLARANKAAESGNCKQAMSLFRKVLDANPASVEALTGLGYCHLDRKEYESARTRFRAALGISSRYQPAMWGIAEAYQQQGLKQEAIERYRRFLEEHPGSPRAGAARRQIQRLGGGASPGGAQPETGSGSGPAPGSEAETGSEPAGGDDEI